MKSLIFIFVLLTACNSNNESIAVGPLKEYAFNYTIASQQSEMLFTLQELPPDVEEIINKRVIDDEFKLYVALILARHYRSHVTFANQSFIINKKHPLWVAFEKFSNIELQSEYELSNVIYYKWLSKKNNLEPILKTEVEAIERELNRIDKTNNSLLTK